MTDPRLIPVPSGQPVTLQEVITDVPGQGLTYRFRFVAPELVVDGGAVDYAMLEPDLDHLCNNYALGRIANTGPRPSQIIISVGVRATMFGATNPDVPQVFESYSIKDDNCIWEAF